jgi:hypothetical protein
MIKNKIILKHKYIIYIFINKSIISINIFYYHFDYIFQLFHTSHYLSLIIVNST